MNINFAAGCHTLLPSVPVAWVGKAVLGLWLASAFPVLAFENCNSPVLSDMERCSGNNYQQEDRQLNSLYNEALMAAVQDKEQIRKSQRQWLKARDTLCAFTPQDGAEHKVYQNICLYEQTRDRNRELEAIITHQRTLSLIGDAVQYRYDENTHKITAVGGAKNSAIYFKEINQSNFNGWFEFVGDKPVIVYDNNSIMNYSTYAFLKYKNNQFYIDCVQVDMRSGYNGIYANEGVCGLEKPVSGDFSKYEEYVYSIVNEYIEKINVIDTASYRNMWVDKLPIILMRNKEYYIYKIYASVDDLFNGEYVIRECSGSNPCRDYHKKAWVITDVTDPTKITILQSKIVNDRLTLIPAVFSAAVDNSKFTPFTIAVERSYFYSDDYQKRKAYLIKDDKVNLVSMTDDKKWCRVQYFNESNKSTVGNIRCEELNK